MKIVTMYMGPFPQNGRRGEILGGGLPGRENAMSHHVKAAIEELTREAAKQEKKTAARAMVLEILKLWGINYKEDTVKRRPRTRAEGHKKRTNFSG